VRAESGRLAALGHQVTVGASITLRLSL
jgi:hypothetical protein